VKGSGERRCLILTREMVYVPFLKHVTVRLDRTIALVIVLMPMARSSRIGANLTARTSWQCRCPVMARLDRAMTNSGPCRTESAVKLAPMRSSRAMTFTRKSHPFRRTTGEQNRYFFAKRAWATACLNSAASTAPGIISSPTIIAGVPWIFSCCARRRLASICT
jgi:hypothetical protein